VLPNILYYITLHYLLYMLLCDNNVIKCVQNRPTVAAAASHDRIYQNQSQNVVCVVTVFHNLIDVFIT